jgi:hypothetical protein
LFFLWFLVKVLQWLRLAWIGVRGGWVVEEDVDGERVEYVWVRKPRWLEWWRRVWGRVRGRPVDVQEERSLLD